MILNAHSNYSLRYGTLSNEELLLLAKQYQHEVVAITDINNTSGVLEFVKLALEQGIKPVVGIEFKRKEQLLFIALARNNAGFREMNELLTAHHLYGDKIPERPDFIHCYVIYPYGKYQPQQLKEHEFIGVKPQHVTKTCFESKAFQQKCVALESPVFKDAAGYDTHKKLCAVHYNILISQLQAHQCASADDVMRPRSETLRIFQQLPLALNNTKMILDDCEFVFDFKSIKNKKHFTGTAYDDKLLLEKLALDGMKQRYGAQHKIAKQRVLKELDIIDKLGFSSYFLITWDIIRYSMQRSFYHVGRGSGANSVVAYCLRITDVCPIELDLYFERFLNPKRKSPPDFDIDYSWKERDEVLDYIFKRYGHKHTALLGAMSTFKDKSIIREMGKVYGLPKADIDRMIDFPTADLNNNELCKEILSHYQAIEDFPNIRSIHAGGVLISEEPITCYTALDMPPKGFLTSQFDMYLAEDIGFEKLDILSQRGIGHIKDCVDIVLQNQGLKIDVHEVERFKKDEKVRAQIYAGDTIGCFYIESPAMRGLLKKLRCDNYITLVAASSIIRPGVAKSGMMKEYIQRFHHPEKFSYLHPVMEQQLKETYGVMVFQEDVLKVAHHFGGLDLADADVLRRMMSGKSRNKKHLEEIVQKYFDNCKERGYPDHITREVWRQIESFAGYSFSKAHSASYAVESYQSLYLKTYFPMEFMVAVINNFGGFYSTRVYVNEARKTGANIELPCVNKSLQYTTIYGSDIYLGFVHIQHLEQHFAQLIPQERLNNGDYKSLEDFMERTQITLEQVIVLIRVGALRFTGKNKKQMLWEAHFLMNHHASQGSHLQLFRLEKKQFELPALESSFVEDVYDEIELIGFPVTRSYFDLLKTSFRGECKAKDIAQHVGKTVRMVGSYVTRKPVRTVRGEVMAFGTFLDDEGNFFDTVHFPPSLTQYPFQSTGVYLLLGRVVEEFGFPSIEVQKMAKLPIEADGRAG